MGVRNKISNIPAGIKFKIHLTRSAIFQEVMDVWPLNVAVGVNDRMWLALHSDGS